MAVNPTLKKSRRRRRQFIVAVVVTLIVCVDRLLLNGKTKYDWKSVKAIQ